MVLALAALGILVAYGLITLVIVLIAGRNNVPPTPEEAAIYDLEYAHHYDQPQRG